LSEEEQADLKAVIPAEPRVAGVPVANWNWKAVRCYLEQRLDKRLGRSSCLRYLHRLGFVWKRPKKRLTKADAEKRAAFVLEYATLQAEAQQSGAKIFFADEAHFRADVDLRGRWVQKGEPALVDSSSPRYGEKASYYSAVCLETGEVEVMELEGNSSSQTSAAFLRQLREHHCGPLLVIWDNGPAHAGDAVREYLTTPHLGLRLVRLPAYSPDYNGDEAIWKWVREEVTANRCLGTKARVQAEVGAFFRDLAQRAEEVQTRCRTLLQKEAAALTTM
jgi:transposase